MKIIVDAMGGDNAPHAAVLGAVQGGKQFGVDLTLVGQGDAILKVLEENGIKELPSGVEIAHASDCILMDDDPTTVLRQKKDSSMVVGLNLLKEGAGDAFISAGNTGALLGGATLITKRIAGIRRATLSPLLPSVDGRTILVDGGANIQCTPEYLLQFAYMGSCYAKHVLNRPNPRVALLNNGAEETKGLDLQLEAHALLKEAHAQGALNFVGNLEGSYVMMGKADVIVADGWSGNILLKTMEGVGTFVKGELKSMFYANLKTKVAGAIMKPSLDAFGQKMSSNAIGGTPLLGVQKAVMKAHGSSDATAFCNAVGQAKHFVDSGYIERVTEQVATMKSTKE